MTALELKQKISRATGKGGIDLHLHSACSDGSASPEELVTTVCEHGLWLFALTDHDTIDGLNQVDVALNERRSRQEANIPDFIPGVELSLEWGEEIHVLAYFPDLTTAESLRPFLEESLKTRQKRNTILLQKLQALGFAICLTDLTKQTSGRPGRLHVAQWLVKHGVVSTIDQAFEKYLGPGGLVYTPRELCAAASGLEAVQQAGGVTFLAHPQHYAFARDSHTLSKHLSALQALGLDGLEVFHGEASPEQQQLYLTLAKKMSLAISAGSDWHGRHTNRPMYDGKMHFGPSVRP